MEADIPRPRTVDWRLMALLTFLIWASVARQIDDGFGAWGVVTVVLAVVITVRTVLVFREQRRSHLRP